VPVGHRRRGNVGVVDDNSKFWFFLRKKDEFCGI
jgi:hypothetical protein